MGQDRRRGAVNVRPRQSESRAKVEETALPRAL
jgi:hypothetical protein